jgi:iron complex outermembrane recepter protein
VRHLVDYSFSPWQDGDIPYVTLAQGFQSLVRSLLGRSEAELGRWCASLGKALGTNRQLIVDLVPELEVIIGKQPAVPELPPNDAKSRFQNVFRRFLFVLHTAMRKQDSGILDDASTYPPLSADRYVLERRPRSVLPTENLRSSQVFRDNARVVLVKSNPTVARACLLGIALKLFTATANAQTTAETAPNTSTAATGDSLAEVVVTAQRRTEDAQTVPIAISAVSGDTLVQTFGVNNVETLQEAVPGLNIAMDTSNTKIFLRGVGTTAVTTDNSVGVYVDGVYIASQGASFTNLANIDHVEVDKGPQGTLFGRNTTGGVVQIVTKTPSSIPSADLTFGYGNYNSFALNFYGTSGIAANLAADFAYYYNNQLDSPGMNVTTGTENIFRQNAEVIRSKWLWTPIDTTAVTLALDYTQDRQATGTVWSFLRGALGVDDKTTYVGFYNTASDLDNHWTDRNYGASLRLEQDFGWSRLVSTTGARDSLDIHTLDQDATPLHLIDANPLPELDKTLTQELQLQSPACNEKFQWIAGLYYMDDRFASLPLVINEGVYSPSGVTFTKVDVYVQEPTRSYAEFGQATWEFLPEARLTLGVRNTDDTKSIGGNTLVDGIDAVHGRQTADFSKVTYRAILDRQFTPDILGYMSWNTGFKSGQYSLVNFTEPPVKPEVLTAYETGFKSQFLDRRLRVNASAFDYKYQDIQVQEVVVGGTQLVNAAQATIYGLDLDTNAKLMRSLSLQVSLEWLHARYTNFPNDPSYIRARAGGNDLNTINGVGFRMPDAPDFSAYGAADYTMPVAGGMLDVTVNASYNSGYYWDPDDRLRQPAFALFGGYLTWTDGERKWSYRLWGNNLTSRRYYTYENAFAFGDVYSPAMPATYGVAVERRF